MTKRLFLPFEATWLGEFKSELLGFPNVRFMDQVDALTQMTGHRHIKCRRYEFTLHEGTSRPRISTCP